MGNWSRSEHGTLPHQIGSSFSSKQLCAVVLPFGKHECQAIPMGLCNGTDIFQEKMSELMDGLAFFRTCIDGLLCLTKGAFSDHLEKVELVLQRLQKAGLKANVTKQFFARSQLEHLGCWITRTGIKPACDKVKAVLKIAEPKTRKELRSFIGVVNHYRDMWVRRSCTDVQNNQVEMGTTTPKGICNGQKDHCKGDAVSAS